MSVRTAEPKTDRSRRQVLLTDLAAKSLTRHRRRQAADRLAVGPHWDDHDLVFTNAFGRPLNPQNVLRRGLRPLLENAGLQKIRFHDLRHTAATLLLGQGVHPKVVSEMLGHSQTAVDLYSHVTPTMQQTAVDALEAVLGRR